MNIILKYYPFKISLNKCTASCNVLSPKICVPKDTKGIIVKEFNIITKKNEAKAMTEHITNTLVTECDEIIIVMNNVSTKKDYSNKCIEYCFNKSS